jgi:peptidoglycan/xylan/chitin deacetylase (PgdA/CDA1 family)
MNNERSLPSKPIILTFDDAFESIYFHAFPVLKEMNYRATIFIITDFVGKENYWDVNIFGKRFKHLSWAQLEEMRMWGIEPGSHTVTHTDLTRISGKCLTYEIIRSKETIRDRLNYDPVAISFPFGRYNAEVISKCVKSGYRIGCGMILNRFQHVSDSFQLIERKAVYGFEGVQNVKAKIEKTFFSPLETFKLRLINLCSNGTSLVKPGHNAECEKS